MQSKIVCLTRKSITMKLKKTFKFFTLTTLLCGFLGAATLTSCRETKKEEKTEQQVEEAVEEEHPSTDEHPTKEADTTASEHPSSGEHPSGN